MGSLVHRSVPIKWFPNCSPAHTLFQDRFKDVQVGSRLFSPLYILSPNFHTKRSSHEAWIKVGECLTINFSTQLGRTTSSSPRPMFYRDSAVTFFCQNWRSFDKQQYFCKSRRPQCPTATPSIIAKKPQK